MNRATPRRSFVVFDRDGTVIVERQYLSEPGQVELIPGVGKGLRALRRLGLGLVIATNQSGIGRGYFDQITLTQIHEQLRLLLQKEEVWLDGIYFCPHTPEEACHCRKPEVGMLEEATSQIGLDPTTSFIVGDNWADIELGTRVGATTLLVRTGYGKQAETNPSVKPDYVVDEISQAVFVIQQLVEQRQGS